MAIIQINPNVMEQDVINQRSREFLNTTDWKIIRHLDQLNLGIATSLSELEYLELLQERQGARGRIA